MEEVYRRKLATDHLDLSRCAAVPDRACDLDTFEADFARKDEVGLRHLRVAVKEGYHSWYRGRKRSSRAVREEALVATLAVKKPFALYLESSEESVKSLSEIDHLEERHQRCSGKPYPAENWAGGRS